MLKLSTALKSVYRRFRTVPGASWKTFEADCRKQLNEIAFFANAAKNSASAYLGDYTAATKLYNGQIIYVDTRDISLAPHLMLSGVWEMDICKVWCKLIEFLSPKNVYDVGANVGFFGLVGAQMCPDAKVSFFEANPRLISLIQKSVAVNGLYQRADVVSKAVSNVSHQHLHLSIPGAYFGSASLSPQLKAVVSERTDIHDCQDVEVLTLALDDYARQKTARPELVKIDVEGHEELALLGMREILDLRECTILMEYTPNAYSCEFNQKLSAWFEHAYRVVDSEIVPLTSLEALNAASDFSMVILTNVDLSTLAKGK